MAIAATLATGAAAMGGMALGLGCTMQEQDTAAAKSKLTGVVQTLHKTVKGEEGKLTFKDVVDGIQDAASRMVAPATFYSDEDDEDDEEEEEDSDDEDEDETPTVHVRPFHHRRLLSNEVAGGSTSMAPSWSNRASSTSPKAGNRTPKQHPRRVSMEVPHCWEGFSMEEAREHADASQAIAMSRTPREVLDELHRGNMRFWTSQSFRPEASAFERRALISKQFPSVAILSCADSRVPPELIFDQGLGDLFVVRVAGNGISTTTKASLQYAVNVLQVKVVVVMGHEFCGAVKAARLPVATLHQEPNDLAQTLKGLKLGLDEELLGQIQDSRAIDREANLMNTRRQLESLTTDKSIMAKVAEGELIIVGAFYEISSGIVDFFHEVQVPAEEAVVASVATSNPKEVAATSPSRQATVASTTGETFEVDTDCSDVGAESQAASTFLMESPLRSPQVERLPTPVADLVPEPVIAEVEHLPAQEVVLVHEPVIAEAQHLPAPEAALVQEPVIAEAEHLPDQEVAFVQEPVIAEVEHLPAQEAALVQQPVIAEAAPPAAATLHNVVPASVEAVFEASAPPQPSADAAAPAAAEAAAQPQPQPQPAAASAPLGGSVRLLPRVLVQTPQMQVRYAPPVATVEARVGSSQGQVYVNRAPMPMGVAQPVYLPARGAAPGASWVAPARPGQPVQAFPWPAPQAVYRPAAQLQPQAPSAFRQ